MDLTAAYRLLDLLNARVEAVKTAAQYASRIWGACERLFVSGNEGNFIASMLRTIDQQLTKAWNEGAAAVGVEPEDMSEDDLALLSSIIDSEAEFVPGLAADILAAREAQMTPEAFEANFGNRADTWANRYPDVVNQATIHFGGKTRLVWRLGQTEEHCTTCAALNGLVAYAEEWEQSGLHPQGPPNDLLECGGWKCDCSLETTDKRRSPRAMDTLINIAMSGNL